MERDVRALRGCKKLSSRALSKLLDQVTCSVLGLRPSFTLIDSCRLSLTTLREVIQLVYKRCIPQESVHIFLLATTYSNREQFGDDSDFDDIFIIRDTCAKMLRPIDKQAWCFMGDANADLQSFSKAAVAGAALQILSQLQFSELGSDRASQGASFSASIISYTLPDNVCGVGLSGWLLGYPVSYITCNKTAHALSSSSLTLYNSFIDIKLGDRDPRTLSLECFSVPADQDDAYSEAIAQWKASLIRHVRVRADALGLVFADMNLQFDAKQVSGDVITM